MYVIYIFSLSIGIDINFVYIFYVIESSTSSREEKSRIRCRMSMKKHVEQKEVVDIIAVKYVNMNVSLYIRYTIFLLCVFV